MVLERPGVQLSVVHGLDWLHLLVGRDLNVGVCHFVFASDTLGLTVDELGIGPFLRLLLLL